MPSETQNLLEIEKLRLDSRLLEVHQKAAESLESSEVVAIIQVCREVRELVTKLNLDDLRAISKSLPHNKLRYIASIVDKRVIPVNAQLAIEIFTIVGEYVLKIEICLLSNQPQKSGELQKSDLYRGTMLQIFNEYNVVNDSEINPSTITDLNEIPEDLRLKLRYAPFIQICLAYEIATRPQQSYLAVSKNAVEQRMDSEIEEAIEGLQSLLPRVPNDQIRKHYFLVTKTVREAFERLGRQNWLELIGHYTIDNQEISALVQSVN